MTSAVALSLNYYNKGFTGHEHMDELGLIHMNGRIYDPRLARFLNADPVVQQIENLQNLNRYSYVLNNPLNATDPTGYFLTSLINGVLAYLSGASVAESLQIAAASYVTGDTQFTYSSASGFSVGESQMRSLESQAFDSYDLGENGSSRIERAKAEARVDVESVTSGVSGTSVGASSGCQTSIDCQGNGNGYDKSDTYYHEYTMSHNICSTDVSSCTVENVYNSLTKNAAPGADGINAVSADKVTEIQMAGVSGGRVSHIADSENSRVVNITHDDHIFYNGIVIRSVVQNDGMISIRSYGEGVNRTNWTYMPDRVSWAANYILAKPGFKQQDNNIRRQVLSLSGDGRGILRREAQFRQQLRSDLMKGPKY